MTKNIKNYRHKKNNKKTEIRALWSQSPKKTGFF